MTLAPGSRLGPYEILAPLGAGGMGEVYRARDPRIGREVAVKVLHQTDSQDPDRLRRFEQEVRAAGSLSHPYILSVFDVGAHEGAPYVVSELLEGETLRARLLAGPLPLRRALDYAGQAAQGLAAAHDKGIVHRDLKPENLFVTRDGRLKILDFGLAKLVRLPGVRSGSGASETVDLTPNTEPGVVVGTVGYMSPEQVRGDAADHRSDIFSFGLVLYEMVTGKRAFQRATPVETMHAILKDDPADPPASLPPAVGRVVAHCLEKDPADRFQSARDLSFDLQSLSERSASGLRAAPALARRRRRAALGAAGLLVLGAALWASYWLGGRAAPPGQPSYKCLTYRRGSLAAARFTGDGRTIVYSASWDGRPEELYTSRVDSPESRLLGFAGSKLLAVSASGELAIMTGERAAEFGTLARVPLAGGTPRQVLENVSAADWSPEGKDLAIVRELGGRSRIEYPIGRSVAETDAFVSELRVSPQGDRLAFVEHDALGTSEGRVVVSDRAGARRVVSKRYGMIEGLAWRPDGRAVWFTALPEVAASLAIYELTPAGGERLVARGPGDIVLHDVAKGGRGLVERDESRFEMRGVPPGGGAERDLSWLDSSFSADLSPDGSLVLFEEYGDGAMGETQTYVRGTDGSPGVRLGAGWALALSPDAKWALTKLESPSRLVLQPTGPGDPRTLPAPPGFTYSIWGAFAPDGRSVLFSAQEPGKGGRWYVQDAAGGAPRPVTPEGVETVAMPSPDGRYLACDGDSTLYPVAGGEPLTIQGLTSQDRPAGFSPDGRFLYVMTRNVVPAAVHRVELKSGRRELWRELKPPDPAGVAFLYRAHIARDGRSYVFSYPRDLSVLYLAEGLK